MKIQGYRVELEEISHCLLTYKQVEHAVVIDQTDENGIKFLVAYVVTEQNISTTELTKAFARSLARLYGFLLILFIWTNYP
ncbi:hypothetical protein AAHB62_09380 [Bacillus cereus]